MLTIKDGIVLDCGWSELFYKGKMRPSINFWVRIHGKDFIFKVSCDLINDYKGSLKSCRRYLISLLNMDLLRDIIFKNYLEAL